VPEEPHSLGARISSTFHQCLTTLTSRASSGLSYMAVDIETGSKDFMKNKN